MERNGHYYFSKGQLERMIKGKEITFIRGGHKLIAGMKQRHKKIEVARLQNRIAKLEKKLAEVVK